MKRAGHKSQLVMTYTPNRLWNLDVSLLLFTRMGPNTAVRRNIGPNDGQRYQSTECTVLCKAILSDVSKLLDLNVFYNDWLLCSVWHTRNALIPMCVICILKYIHTIVFDRIVNANAPTHFYNAYDKCTTNCDAIGIINVAVAAAVELRFETEIKPLQTEREKNVIRTSEQLFLFSFISVIVMILKGERISTLIWNTSQVQLILSL